MLESTAPKAQEQNKEEPDKTKADQTITIQETGKTAWPLTSECIFSGCESF